LSSAVAGLYLGFFCWGGKGEAQVVKASRYEAEGGVWAPPENFEKLDALRGVFPPSQKLKVISTKCIFWVNFVGKTLRSDKNAI
jgi:hypothetical protein